MRALLDVNVLLALFDPDHVHHDRATGWWGQNRAQGWASCPITQNGFVRIATSPSYTNPFPPARALSTLSRQVAMPGHEFWAEDISLTDAAVFDQARITGPKQITDVYLLALAVKHGGRLVTFDRGVAAAAVRGAGSGNLVVI